MSVTSPTVSVVMGVFNGARHVATSIESILSQRRIDLELIVVDDGSTDDTCVILGQFARSDHRVRCFRQDHRGLTEALIRGCGEARGRLIARQDAGDLSFSTRLVRQADHLAANPSIKLSSCWTRYVGPEGENLFELRYEEPAEAVTRLLRSPDVRSHRGIGHHGSAMFRRQDYLAVGGYRGEFAVAQDLDLWLRLTDHGSVGFVPEVLYEARYSPSGISARFRSEQERLAMLAIQMRKVRETGADEKPLLLEAAGIRPQQEKAALSCTAEGFYFIGKCLLARRDARASRYLRAAFRRRPWDLRVWAALGLSALQRV
jgi:glycosyltransferase involved in cell wall biosynthesis